MNIRMNERKIRLCRNREHMSASRWQLSRYKNTYHNCITAGFVYRSGLRDFRQKHFQIHVRIIPTTTVVH